MQPVLCWPVDMGGREGDPANREKHGMSWRLEVTRQRVEMFRRSLLLLEDAHHLYSESDDESLVGQVEESVTKQSET